MSIPTIRIVLVLLLMQDPNLLLQSLSVLLSVILPMIKPKSINNHIVTVTTGVFSFSMRHDTGAQWPNGGGGNGTIRLTPN